jgi:hypothetical protein
LPSSGPSCAVQHHPVRAFGRQWSRGKRSAPALAPTAADRKSAASSCWLQIPSPACRPRP